MSSGLPIPQHWGQTIPPPPFLYGSLHVFMFISTKPSLHKRTNWGWWFRNAPRKITCEVTQWMGLLVFSNHELVPFWNQPCLRSARTVLVRFWLWVGLCTVDLGLLAWFSWHGLLCDYLPQPYVWGELHSSLAVPFQPWFNPDAGSQCDSYKSPTHFIGTSPCLPFSTSLLACVMLQLLPVKSLPTPADAFRAKYVRQGTCPWPVFLSFLKQQSGRGLCQMWWVVGTEHWAPTAAASLSVFKLLFLLF